MSVYVNGDRRTAVEKSLEALQRSGVYPVRDIRADALYAVMNRTTLPSHHSPYMTQQFVSLMTTQLMGLLRRDQVHHRAVQWIGEMFAHECHARLSNASMSPAERARMNYQLGPLFRANY